MLPQRVRAQKTAIATKHANIAVGALLAAPQLGTMSATPPTRHCP